VGIATVRAALCGLVGLGASGAAAAALPTIQLEVVSEATLVTPVGLTHAGDGSDRLFVVDQRGKIQIIRDGSVLPAPFLDIGSKLVPARAGFDERGLLGLAFHPDYATSGALGEGKFYVMYSAPSPNAPGTAANPVDCRTVIAEYGVSAPGSDLADPASERILLSFDKPQFNHNGGQLAFGPDRMLYIGVGDGGGSDDNDPGHTGGSASKPSGGLGNGQDLTRLLGKLLRIDVDGNSAGAYGIPADNPFVDQGSGVREEIFAYGLRNPWRFSFDRLTGELLLADVGQRAVEEVDLVQSGGNYGWRIREGTFPFDASVPDPGVPLLDPIAEYTHPGVMNGLLQIGLSVTGGFVYRGSEFPELSGKYVFGDWSSSFASGRGTLLVLSRSGSGSFELAPFDVVGGNPIGKFITSFGEDEQGELYVVAKGTLGTGTDPVTGQPTGVIYRIHALPEPSIPTLQPAGLAALALAALWLQARALRRAARRRPR
jgi:glucose/arabinose dehydrogenase